MVKLTNYPLKVGYSCLISSVVNAINYCNQDIDDGIFFLLGEGFNLFDYSSENFRSISDIHFNQLSYRVVETFFNIIGIRCKREKYCNSIDECKERIKKDIKLEYPLVFNVSSASLIYSDLWVSGDREHYFTVIGIDDDGVIIADIYLADVFGQNISVYKGGLDFLRFQEACMRFDWGYLSIDYETLKRTKLSFSKEYLLNELEKNLCFYLHGNTSYYQKLIQFADDICQFPNKFSNVNLMSVMILAKLMLKLISLCFQI